MAAMQAGKTAFVTGGTGGIGAAAWPPKAPGCWPLT